MLGKLINLFIHKIYYMNKLINFKIGDKIDDDIIILDILGGEGRSSSGLVYIILSEKVNKIIAAKTLQHRFVNNKEYLDDFKNEVLIWTKLKHPNIIEAVGVEIYNDIPFIIMEPVLMFNGKLSLNDYFLELYDYKTLDWAIQLCCALEYMENEGIKYHGDIKPDNILIQEDTVKLTDFGLSNYLDNFEDARGSSPYMAPESFDGIKNIKTDIYSFGVVLYQMINNGKLPFEVKRGLDKEWIEVHKSHNIPKFNHFLYDVVVKCLSKNSNNRYKSFKNLKEELISIFENKFSEEYCVPVVNNPYGVNYYYFRAQTFANLEYIEEAIENYEKAIDLNPIFSDIRINYAINLIKWGKYDLALEHLKVAKKVFYECEKRFVKIYRLYFNLGHAYQLKDNLSKSIYYYKRAIKENPNYLEVYVNLGNVYFDCCLFNNALECYDHVLNINPNFYEALMNKGKLYGYWGDEKNANIYFCRAEEIKPTEDLYGLWGMTLRNLHNEPSALSKFLKMINLNKESIKGYYNIFTSHLIMGNLECSQDALNSILELVDDEDEYKMSFSLEYNKYGFKEEAMDLLEDVTNENYKCDALLQKAFILSDDVNKSISLLDDIIASDCSDRIKSDAFQYKALCLIKLNSNEVIYNFDKGLELNKENISIYLNKSKYYADNGMLKESNLTLDDGLKINSRNKEFLERKINLLLSLEKFDDALYFCDLLEDIDKPSFEVLTYKIISFISLGNFFKANELLNTAFNFVSDDEELDRLNYLKQLILSKCKLTYSY